MPKSRFDEIALPTSPCRMCFRRSRQLEQLRPDFRSDPEGRCDSNCCESNRPTSGADQKDQRAKCEDRHAFAANPETPVTAVQSTPWGHDWRRRALDFNIYLDDTDIYSGAGRTIDKGRRWQQPCRCPRRNAHIHRKDPQRERERPAKIQSHRQSFEVAGWPDTLDSAIADTVAIIFGRIIDGGSLQSSLVFAQTPGRLRLRPDFVRSTCGLGFVRSSGAARRRFD